jgi:hypothetical protein
MSRNKAPREDAVIFEPDGRRAEDSTASQPGGTLYFRFIDRRTTWRNSS